MSVWVWVALGLGALLLLAATAAVAVFGWRAYQRRITLRLLGRTEAIEAAGAALTDVVERLSRESDAELEHFASDINSPERRAMHEVANRAEMLYHELDRMPLPKKLIPAGEAMADAAYVVAEQAACVRDEHTGLEALEDLGSVDLAVARDYTRSARAAIVAACEECGVEETALYGGGLYL